MDEGAPKEITITCKKCNSEKVMKAHWKNSIIYSICKECNREFRYELKDWKQK